MVGEEKEEEKSKNTSKLNESASKGAKVIEKVSEKDRVSVRKSANVVVPTNSSSSETNQENSHSKVHSSRKGSMKKQTKALAKSNLTRGSEAGESNVVEDEGPVEWDLGSDKDESGAPKFDPAVMKSQFNRTLTRSYSLVYNMHILFIVAFSFSFMVHKCQTYLWWWRRLLLQTVAKTPIPTTA